METYIQAHTENRDSVLEPLLKRGTHFMRNEGFCKHKTDLHQRSGFMVNSAQGENMDFPYLFPETKIQNLTSLKSSW